MSASSEAAPDRVPASIEPLPDRPEILPHPPSAALLGRPSAIRSLDHAHVRAGRRISNSLAQTRGADLGAAFVSLSGMCSRPPAARRARHHRLQCTGLTRSGFVAVVPRPIARSLAGNTDVFPLEGRWQRRHTTMDGPNGMLIVRALLPEPLDDPTTNR